MIVGQVAFAGRRLVVSPSSVGGARTWCPASGTWR
jgi:hypothetical protein